MSPLALQSDGKIIVAGDLSNGSNLDIAVARYTEDGVPDTTFDTDGITVTDLGGRDESREVHVQDDGKIVVGGFGGDGVGPSGFVLVRYDADGSLDAGFATNGVGLYMRGGSWHEAYAMHLGNGHAYLAGQVNYDGAALDVLVNGAGPVARFNDVPPDYWAFSFIETLAASGITAGCGNDNYCPTAPVTRAQMAVFLERGIHGSNFSPPAATGNVFLDVSAESFAASFIEQFFLDGITSGCGNNNYCPSAEVTRDQMAVFLLRAKHGSGYSPPPATGVFDDVPLSHWAVHWIEQLAAEGITAGCGNGNYCPDAVVTRDQMAVFLVRTFGL